MNAVQLDLWVYIVVGILAVAMIAGGAFKTISDKKKAAAKKASANLNRRR